MKGKERLNQNIISNAESFKSAEDIANYRYASVKSGHDRKGDMCDIKTSVNRVLRGIGAGSAREKGK